MKRFTVLMVCVLFVLSSCVKENSNSASNANQAKNEKSLDQNLITKIEELSSSLELRGGTDLGNIQKSSLPVYVSNMLDIYSYVLTTTDSVYDSSVISSEAINDGFSTSEAKTFKVKAAYRANEVHHTIYGITNYTPKQAIYEFDAWEAMSDTMDVVNTSSWYSTYGRTMIQSYVDEIRKKPGNSSFRYGLAKACYDLVTREQTISQDEKTSLQLAFAMEQATVIFIENGGGVAGPSWSFFDDMDDCQKRTVTWIVGTMASFLLCDGCAAGAYVVGVVGVVVDC